MPAELSRLSLNVLDPNSLLSNLGALGVLLVLFAETGLLVIGAAQIAALATGISRSGVAMAAGLVKGLDHEDAARFSFLLATPGSLLPERSSYPISPARSATASAHRCLSAASSRSSAHTSASPS